jgi:hypothetical protein
VRQIVRHNRARANSVSGLSLAQGGGWQASIPVEVVGVA